MNTNGNGNGNGTKYSKQGIAMQLLEIFSDPKRWIKGPYARKIDGQSVYPSHPSAVSWCSAGAMFKLREEVEHGSEQRTALDKFIPYWNQKAIEMTSMGYVEVNECMGLMAVRRVLEAIKAEA